MDTANKGNEVLRIIGLLCKQNMVVPVDLEKVRLTVELNVEEMNGVIAYLMHKHLIDKIDTDKLILTGNGIDEIARIKQGKEYRELKFLYPESTGSPSTDGSEFTFYYQIYKGKEKIEDRNKVIVKISRTLETNWINQFRKLRKELNVDIFIMILFQYAKNHVIEKLKNNTLEKVETIELYASYTDDSDKCLYTDFDILIDPNDVQYEIEMPYSVKNDSSKLASLIVHEREIINERFVYLHKDRLLTNDNERALFDLINDANTFEEFIFRQSSLVNLARTFNEKKLRDLTGITDKEIRSISLLETYLKSKGYENLELIKTLRRFSRIRQAYPIHTDTTGIKVPLEELGVKYPVNDFKNSWNILLTKYYEALKELSEILSELN